MRSSIHSESTMKRSVALAVALFALLAIGCETEDNGAKCEEVKALLNDCYTSSCMTAGAESSSFCGCWNQDLDLNVLTCSCVQRQEDAVCEVYNLDSFSVAGFSCTNAMDYLAGQCTDSTPVVEPDAGTSDEEDAEPSDPTDADDGDSGPTG